MFLGSVNIKWNVSNKITTYLIGGLVSPHRLYFMDKFLIIWEDILIFKRCCTSICWCRMGISFHMPSLLMRWLFDHLVHDSPGGFHGLPGNNGDLWMGENPSGFGAPHAMVCGTGGGDDLQRFITDGRLSDHISIAFKQCWMVVTIAVMWQCWITEVGLTLTVTWYGRY